MCDLTLLNVGFDFNPKLIVSYPVIVSSMLAGQGTPASQTGVPNGMTISMLVLFPPFPQIPQGDTTVQMELHTVGWCFC